MKIFGITNKGEYRAENQDTFGVFRSADSDVAIVCDGMGGAAAGKIASTLAVERFTKAFRLRRESGEMNIREIFHQAVDAANREVYDSACTEPDYMGMGTTLVAACFTDEHVCIVNVGDSRAYRVSKSGISQITKDHSLVQALVDSGELTPAQARVSPNRNLITRAVGTEFFVRDEVFDTEAGPDEIFMLCSDGVTNAIDNAELHRLILSSDTPEEACKKIEETALANQARDNFTVVVIMPESEVVHNG